jgi:ribosomal protein S18 acetylase RimI-like enzyme
MASRKERRLARLAAYRSQSRYHPAHPAESFQTHRLTKALSSNSSRRTTLRLSNVTTTNKLEAEFESWQQLQPWYPNNKYVVIGFKHSFVAKHDLYIESISVSRYRRRKGVARAILAKLIEISEAHGIPLTLEADETSRSKWIQEWYIRHGFEYVVNYGDFGPYMIRYPKLSDAERQERLKKAEDERAD